MHIAQVSLIAVALAFGSYMLTCLNQHSVTVAEWSGAILRLRIAATSITVIVIGWCGHRFEPICSHICWHTLKLF